MGTVDEDLEDADTGPGIGAVPETLADDEEGPDLGAEVGAPDGPPDGAPDGLAEEALEGAPEGGMPVAGVVPETPLVAEVGTTPGFVEDIPGTETPDAVAPDTEATDPVAPGIEADAASPSPGTPVTLARAADILDSAAGSAGGERAPPGSPFALGFWPLKGLPCPAL